MMDSIISESIETINSMAKESCTRIIKHSTQVAGKRTCVKAVDMKPGQMVVATKGNGATTASMEKAYLPGPMVGYFLECLRTINLKERES